MDNLDNQDEVPETYIPPNQHSWVAGMMYVHNEDLETVFKTRDDIECDKCEMSYSSYSSSNEPCSYI